MSANRLSVGVPLAEVTRRDDRSGVALVESIHCGHLVVVGPDGDVVTSVGDPRACVFVRSAAKPFQSAAALELLGSGSDDLTDAEVAVSWASHRGEARHLRAVTTLLGRSGTAPGRLSCPPATAEATPGAAPSRLQHNCSGKHAMFALAAATAGTSGDDVLDPASALQHHLIAALSRRLGGLEGVGIDGCGAPAVAAAMEGLARAYASLATSPSGERIRSAGFAHPLLVGGDGRLESALLAAGVVAKAGAEGLYAAGWVDRDGGSWGLVTKGTDGSMRGVASATIAVLERCGVVPDGTWSPPRPTGGGRAVGRVRGSPSVDDVIRALGDRARR